MLICFDTKIWEEDDEAINEESDGRRGKISPFSDPIWQFKIGYFIY